MSGSMQISTQPRQALGQGDSVPSPTSCPAPHRCLPRTQSRMQLTSLFLPPRVMGFYLCRPSASSSLPSAKLNSSLSPFGKGGFASTHLLWTGQTRTGTLQAGREASAQLQEKQVSLGSWQHPPAHGQ